MIFDLNIWKLVLQLSLEGEKWLVLVDGGKGENRLDDNNTFKRKKMNKGKFGTWNLNFFL
jgi:hypothetical protein